jgi:hypothetical protein
VCLELPSRRTALAAAVSGTPHLPARSLAAGQGVTTAITSVSDDRGYLDGKSAAKARVSRL